MLTNVQLINALMVQLDALQVSGVTNCARIYDMYQMLKSLKEALEKEEAANGNTSDRGEGNPL